MSQRPVPRRESSYVQQSSRARRIVSLLIPLLVSAVVVSGCNGNSSGTNTGTNGKAGASNENGFVGGDGRLTLIEPAKRKPAPALSGKTLTDDIFTLADHAGSVVVLNVWGSWCPPCRKEAPDLQAAYTRLQKEATGKVVFVGINTRDADTGPALAFERRFDITYPSVFDPSGKQLLGFSIPASAIPSTLVIDAKGRVAARILGPTTTTTLVDLVKEIEKS